MDEKDRGILKELIADGRVSLKKIARELGLPVTTVFNRVKKMQDTGILRVTAELDRKKLGYGMDFYVLASVDTSTMGIDQEKLARKLVALPGVLSAAVITGSRDLLIKATARDIDELSELVLKHIRGVEGISSTETLVVMKEFTGRKDKLINA